MTESPAEGAGIVRGDRILEVDGVQVDPLTTSQVVSLLRGPAGSSVQIKVAAKAPESPRRLLTLERRPLPQPPLLVRPCECVSAGFLVGEE
jgi:C-terminal processing protease CtpA/Prc